MQCPKCQSADVYLCSVAYQHGTTQTQTTTTTTGSVSGSGYSGMVDASHESTSTSQTEFAKQAAPPTSVFGGAMASVVVLLLINIGVALFYRYGQTIREPFLLKAVLLLALLGAIAWAVVAYKNLPGERAAKEQWSRTWICSRCGSKFIPDP